MKSNNKTRARITSSFFVGLLIISSCGATSNPAAKINGEEISREELEQTITELSDAGQTPVVDGEIAGDTARSVLGALIQGQASLQLLADYDQQITQEDRDSVKSSLSQNTDTAEFTDHLKNLIINLNAGTLALARILPPDAKTVATMYEKAPASLGVMCIRHLVVKEEAKAKEAFKKFSNGADFATLAGEYSIEPNAKQSGGALSGADNACMKLSEYQSGFDPLFTAGALLAKPGVAFGPVKSSFGYHLIYVRPFVEVAEDISTLLESAPGETLLDGYIATSKIVIDSAYGRWDAASGAVVTN
ncbi:MAG: peptidylprolyl isomerase [Actinomycetota bacterium]|nr:peptidylprolyl isomerase [Actinomycetota bacterium]